MALPISAFHMGTEAPPGYWDDYRTSTSLGSDLARTLGLGLTHLGSEARAENRRDLDRADEESRFQRTLAQRQAEHEDTMAYHQATLDAQDYRAELKQKTSPKVYRNAKTGELKYVAGEAPEAVRPAKTLDDYRRERRAAPLGSSCANGRCGAPAAAAPAAAPRPAGPATASAMGGDWEEIPAATYDDYLRMGQKREDEETKKRGRTATLKAIRGTDTAGYLKFLSDDDLSAIAENPAGPQILNSIRAERERDELATAAAKERTAREAEKKKTDEGMWRYYRKEGQRMLEEAPEGAELAPFMFASGGTKLPTAALKEQVAGYRKSIADAARAEDARDLAEYRQGKIDERELARRAEGRVKGAQGRVDKADAAVRSIKLKAAKEGYVDDQGMVTTGPYASMFEDAVAELNAAHLDLGNAVHRLGAISNHPALKPQAAGVVPASAVDSIFGR